jgi:hypothetical protein
LNAHLDLVTWELDLLSTGDPFSREEEAGIHRDPIRVMENQTQSLTPKVEEAMLVEGRTPRGHRVVLYLPPDRGVWIHHGVGGR